MLLFMFDMFYRIDMIYIFYMLDIYYIFDMFYMFACVCFSCLLFIKKNTNFFTHCTLKLTKTTCATLRKSYTL